MTKRERDAQRMREWRADNPVRAKAIQRKQNALAWERVKADPEKLREYYARRREERRRNADVIRERDRVRKAARRHDPDYKAKRRDAVLRSRYGVSSAEFDVQLAAQGGVCGNPACSTPTDESSHLDHNHETGEPRGILCRHCNTMEGMLTKHADKIAGLAVYRDAGGIWERGRLGDDHADTGRSA